MSVVKPLPTVSRRPWPLWMGAALVIVVLLAVAWQRQQGGPDKDDGGPVRWQQRLNFEDRANGDIGVVVGRGEERQVLFSGGRLLHPARLSGAEPALALTVHKAQGSQYAEVLLLLPSSRQSDARLLYTGLTRARQRAVLFTPTPVPVAETGSAA